MDLFQILSRKKKASLYLLDIFKIQPNQPQIIYSIWYVVDAKVSHHVAPKNVAAIRMVLRVQICVRVSM